MVLLICQVVDSKSFYLIPPVRLTVYRGTRLYVGFPFAALESDNDSECLSLTSSSFIIAELMFTFMLLILLQSICLNTGSAPYLLHQCRRSLSLYFGHIYV